jgi:hypothetical protein
VKRLGLTALLIGSLLAGCGSSTPPGGDPGDRRLHALQEDPVVAATPPGASDLSRESTKARYRKPGFDAGGWDGPTVTVRFASSAEPSEVFRFYGERAKAAGWEATASGSLGVPDRWRKTFDGGAPATLFLARLGESRYQLLGGIAPKG